MRLQLFIYHSWKHVLCFNVVLRWWYVFTSVQQQFYMNSLDWQVQCLWHIVYSTITRPPPPAAWWASWITQDPTVLGATCKPAPEKPQWSFIACTGWLSFFRGQQFEPVKADSAWFVHKQICKHWIGSWELENIKLVCAYGDRNVSWINSMIWCVAHVLLLHLAEHSVIVKVLIICGWHWQYVYNVLNDFMHKHGSAIAGLQSPILLWTM